ncbi:MAG: hypothetical protein A2X58_09365 [Nitrospirae bacterium GWC2_56_14]|nr:MAG: hypothetical protein A2X58_09365 [Nitrospirae bacterium GWC2_56_14]
MSVAASRKSAKAPARPPKKSGAAAVSRIRVPRPSGDVPVPPGPAVKLSNKKATDDPRFKKMTAKLQKSALKSKKHPPASQKTAEAQAAALPPANEKLAGAQANKADAMASAQTGKPEPTSFLSMLRAEIQKVMPKKTKDAGDFMKGDDREQLKGAMTGNVEQQKSRATAGIKSASDAPLDTASIEAKQVAPLPPEQTPGQPPAVGGADAMPAPKPAEETSLAQGKQDTEKLLSGAEVSTPQLEKANDPRFTAVVTTKSKADQFADSGPKQYQKQEQGLLSKAGAQASADEKKGLLGFLATGIKAGQGVQTKQLSAKEKDEAERRKVADHIQGIFEKTKETVDKKLANLDEEVSAVFDRGTDNAVAKMRDYVDSRFKKRYSGLDGKLLKGKDWLFPLPDAVKAWFDQAHKIFLQELDALVVRVANLVEARLKEAKDEIARGQKKISEYVKSLPGNLKAVGAAAEKEMAGKFDELRQGVDEKKNDLAQKLAQRYKDASEKGAKALQEMKDAHKSLYEKVRDAIAEVVKVLREFKNKIMGLLRKSKAAIDLIVADPIGFLKNLLKAVGKGLSQFVENIWTHLKEGFMAWLFGSLAESGVEVPKDMSLPSLLKLVLQVLGLTYQRIRAKAVKVLGERAVSVIEKVAMIIKELVTSGPAKLWEMMKEYLGNLKEMVIDAIQDWVVTTVIKAAVLKLVSMFNPVGAIIQAIITIYNVVMFFIERIRQIMAFVESVINSVYEIATGAIGSAANWIEKALARTIPIIIAFLARLLGITGITEKIVGIIKKIQAKVDLAIEKVITKIAKGIGKLIGAGKAAVGKIFQWWKTKKKFKTSKGESHSIFFEGEGRSAELMIASTKNKFLLFVKQLDTKKDPEKEKAKTAAISTAKQIDSLKARVSTKKGDVKDETPEFEKLTQQLAEQTKIFMDRTDALPASETPKYGTLREGYGTSMLIEPLTKIGPPGSVPSASSNRWERLNMRKEVVRSYYIRGHLLNHNIHGPGTTWKNLTPLSQKGNKNHLAIAEKEVKKAVASGEILRYEVVAKFERQKNTALIEQVNKLNISETKKEDIRTVIHEEQFMPAYLLCTAHTLENSIDEKTKKRKIKKTLVSENTKVDNTVDDQDVKQYNVVR